MIFSLVEKPLVKNSFWCAFGEIKIDFTPKKSNILYTIKHKKSALHVRLLVLSYVVFTPKTGFLTTSLNNDRLDQVILLLLQLLLLLLLLIIIIIIIIIIMIIMIMIKITLFQADNIFGTDASITYGPPLTDVDMLLKK